MKTAIESQLQKKIILSRMMQLCFNFSGYFSNSRHSVEEKQVTWMQEIRILPTGPKEKTIYLLPYAIKGINIRMTKIFLLMVLLVNLKDLTLFSDYWTCTCIIKKRKSDIKVLCLNTKLFTRLHLTVVFNACSFQRHRMRYQISMPSWSFSMLFIPDRDLSKAIEPVGRFIPSLV